MSDDLIRDYQKLYDKCVKYVYGGYCDVFGPLIIDKMGNDILEHIRITLREFGTDYISFCRKYDIYNKSTDSPSDYVLSCQLRFGLYFMIKNERIRDIIKINVFYDDLGSLYDRYIYKMKKFHYKLVYYYRKDRETCFSLLPLDIIDIIWEYLHR